MEIKNMAYWKRKNGVPENFDKEPEAGDSPAKFLGMGKGGAGGGLTGKKVLKGLLNPAGAIANKMGMGDTGLGKMLNPGKLLGFGK